MSTMTSLPRKGGADENDPDAVQDAPPRGTQRTSSHTAPVRSHSLRRVRPALALFALGLAALGALSVIYRDFAFDWQPVPPFHGRGAVAMACGLILLLTTLALFFRGTVVIASRLLLAILLAWLCLKVPVVITAPLVEGAWIGFGEVGMVLAGGLVLFANLSELQDTLFLGWLTGQQGMRIAQIIFGLAVIPVGLGHIFYVDITTSLVPSWLPFRHELAYLTGIAQIICGLGLVLAIAPRTAALVEACMVGLFAFLVWGPDSWFTSVPKFAGTPPGMRFPLTAFLITWTVGAAALLIDSVVPSHGRGRPCVEASRLRQQ